MDSYRNFRIELTDYIAGNKRENIAESLKVRVVDSPVRVQTDSEKVIVKIPSDLAERHKMLQRRELDEEQIIGFGEELANLLLPPEVRQLYFLSRARLKLQQGLRIQINTNESRLKALPWEYVYVWAPDGSGEPIKHAGFLALDREISIVRHQYPKKNKKDHKDNTDHKDKKEKPGAEIVRIGALLSDGREAGHQELDMVREKNNIEQALNGVEGAELQTFPDGKLGGILEWLTVNDVKVFHFAGHGTIEKEPLKKAFTFREEKNLVLVGEDGGEQLWDDERVAMALRDRGIRLVVLSACDSGGEGPDNPRSGGMSALVQNKIPAVVGMQFTVRDANAIAFSRYFYLALASGKPIDTAVSEGRQAIFQRPVDAGRDWGVPVLHLQTDQAELFPKSVKSLIPQLILLGTAVIVLGFWFFVHIYPWLYQNISKFWEWLGIGGAALAGLFLVFKTLGVETLKLLPQREKGSWKERSLRHPHSSLRLSLVCIAALVLLASTNSIYLKVDSERDLKVNVRTSNKSLWKGKPTLKLFQHEGRLLAGGPVFFNRWPVKLIPSVETPVGWNLSKKSFFLHPFRSSQLKIYRSLIILLVPGDALADHVFEYEKFQVEVTIGDGEPVILEDWESTPVLLGTPKKDLRLKRSWDEDMKNCSEEYDLSIEENFEDIEYLPSASLAQGQSIIVEVVETNKPDASVEYSEEFTLEEMGVSEDGVFTKCLILED